MLIDLQSHSTYSDGYMSPTELARFLANQGVKIASLTDHNTVGGWSEFKRACVKFKIKPIVGIELYSKLNRKHLSVLWYNFDHADAALHEMLRSSQVRRRNQVRKLLKKMTDRGFKINIDQTLDKYNHYVSINHLIDDIMAVPANRNKIRKELSNPHPREEEIIHHYFFRSKNTKLNNSFIDLKRIIALRKRIGGQLIFNHPGRYNQLNKELLVELKKLGVNGLEVLSPHHSVGAVLYSQHLAHELNLIATGGSDFHLFENRGALKSSWQYFKIDSSHLKDINKIIG
jgi:hypothetical protein